MIVALTATSMPAYMAAAADRDAWLKSKQRVEWLKKEESKS